MLQQFGVDAITLGNHEFDLGPNALLSEFATTFPNPNTAIPFLSANAQNIPAGLAPYIHPYIIRIFNGVKVGIFGLTTHSTNTLSNPSPIVFDENFIQQAAITAGTLQALGCQFIICLSHYGIFRRPGTGNVRSEYKSYNRWSRSLPYSSFPDWEYLDLPG